MTWTIGQGLGFTCQALQVSTDRGLPWSQRPAQVRHRLHTGSGASVWRARQTGTTGVGQLKTTHGAGSTGGAPPHKQAGAPLQAWQCGPPGGTSSHGAKHGCLSRAVLFDALAYQVLDFWAERQPAPARSLQAAASWSSSCVQGRGHQQMRSTQCAQGRGHSRGKTAKLHLVYAARAPGHNAPIAPTPAALPNNCCCTGHSCLAMQTPLRTLRPVPNPPAPPLPWH